MRCRFGFVSVHFLSVALLLLTAVRTAYHSLFEFYSYDIVHFKGQLISKCLFCVFNFFQKTNENTSYTSKNKFIRCFWKNSRLDNLLSTINLVKIHLCAWPITYCMCSCSLEDKTRVLFINVEYTHPFMEKKAYIHKKHYKHTVHN